MRKLQRGIAATVLLIAATTAQAQSIVGRVVDAKTKEPLIGAVVSLQGTDTKTVTDTDGQFHFDHLSTTTPYTLLVKYVGYKNTTIDGVLSKASAAEDVLTVALKPDEQQLKGVTVTGVKRRNTVTAAVLEVKNSPVIVSNISAQDIKLTQDANAGEVIRRVPGVSLIDDKFVMVRGLAQRYNNVWMNGGAVPSSEADQRAFSFDMIPSNQIDNLTIVKSPTPEYPADYTGGFIMIDTKEIPLENAFHVSVGGNWNSASAFKSFLATKQSRTDFLGFDNGLRSLHGGIDAPLANLGKNSGGNTMYSLSDNHLNNDWAVKNQHPWGDLKLAADWSHSWTLPAGKLGAIAAVNYTNEYRVYRDMLNNFYGAYDTENDRSNPLRLSTDNQYNHNVRLGALFNMTLLSASGKNKYQFKNVFNQIGNNRYTWREGLSAQSEPERSAEYYYRSRTTYTGQITGRHTLSGDALDWSVGYAYANRRLPDRRKYILYNEDDSKSDNYVWLYQNDISREWTSLDEHIVSANVNDEHQFAFGDWQPKVKVGAYGEYRTRKYTTRNFMYWYNAEGNSLPSGFRSMEMTSLLSNADNYGADKLYLLEDVNKINDYSGHNTLGAGYVSAALPFGRLDIHAGVRFEYNQMELISNSKSYETSHESHYYRHSDLFPSANATYKIDEKNQIRLSYGRSVNRPEFREVSPSVYYDFDLASNVEGNFNLKNCYVDNLDLRYEWYPSRGEMISLAAFYKHFDSPIEWVYTMAGGTDVIYSYANARSANNYGLELDIRKNLAFMGLPDLNWSFNGSLIHSRVNFEPGSNEESRAMQGQSPYLVNTGLFYKSQPLDLDIALLYNRIGKRIVGVGRSEGMDKNVKVPNSYEMPRDAFDLTVSKRFGKHVELKLAARDLLNQDITFKQFTTVSVGGSSKKVQEVTRRYKPGRNLQATVTFKL